MSAISSSEQVLFFCFCSLVGLFLWRTHMSWPPPPRRIDDDKKAENKHIFSMLFNIIQRVFFCLWTKTIYFSRTNTIVAVHIETVYERIHIFPSIGFVADVLGVNFDGEGEIKEHKTILVDTCCCIDRFGLVFFYFSGGIFIGRFHTFAVS